MRTEDVSTLKIHKLTQEQYNRELAAGNIDETAIYLTPDEEAPIGFMVVDDENEKLQEFADETSVKLLGKCDGVVGIYRPGQTDIPKLINNYNYRIICRYLGIDDTVTAILDSDGYVVATAYNSSNKDVYLKLRSKSASLVSSGYMEIKRSGGEISDIDSLDIRIYRAIVEPQVDTKPTFDSDNLITSGAVAHAIQGLVGGEAPTKYFPGSESDLNDVLDEILNAMPDNTTGFYRIYDNEGVIWCGGAMTATVYKTDNNYATVDFHSYAHYRARLCKTKYEGTWRRLVWTNPPMVAGIEYRTTERINGLDVIKKFDGNSTLYRLSGESEWKPYATAVGAVDAWTVYTNVFNVSEATYDKIISHCWEHIPVRTGFLITLRGANYPYTGVAVGYKSDHEYGSFIFMHYGGSTAGGTRQFVNYYGQNTYVSEI